MVLLGGCYLHHSRDLKLITVIAGKCEGVAVSPAMSHWQRSLQVSTAFVSAAWHCFFYSRAFFDRICRILCRISRGQNGLCRETVFSLCRLILFVSPLRIRLQNTKQSGYVVTHDGLGGRSDVAQMSFRMLFKSRAISSFQETSLLSRCTPLEKGG